jgi:hypothetical protein
MQFSCDLLLFGDTLAHFGLLCFSPNQVLATYVNTTYSGGFVGWGIWLSDMDSNHDKLLQRELSWQCRVERKSFVTSWLPRKISREKHSCVVRWRQLLLCQLNGLLRERIT